MKKILLFLLILVVASLLFTNNNTKASSSNADEIVEIIEGDSATLSDGYVNNENVKENSNFFVIIIKVISYLFKSIINGLFNAAGKIISVFTS